jgi:hypothetical protein
MGRARVEVEAGRMGGGLEGWVLIGFDRLWRFGSVACTLLLAGSLPGSCRACSSAGG